MSFKDYLKDALKLPDSVLAREISGKSERLSEIADPEVQKDLSKLMDKINKVKSVS